MRATNARKVLIMQSTTSTAPISKTSLWAGRIISGLMALFLLFDGVMKVLKAKPVLEASDELGIPENAIVGIGIALIVSTVVYVVPRASVLGAILLTGYLGGAIMTHVRMGGPAFSIAFAFLFGVLVWLGLYLRDERLRTLIPFRS
jgi:hypothetical protein